MSQDDKPSKSSDSSSDSDEEVAMLQNMSLQDISTLKEPVTGTGFIYHEIMAQHKCEWDSNYPENPMRIIQPFLRCTELGLVQRCVRLPIRYATEDEIICKHTRDHVQLAQSTANMTTEEHMALCEKYDAWYANKVTYEASLIAAGSTLSMVEHILQDKLSNGFAMVRPPGHHAMEQEFNGYCTFNNVALAAQYALNSGIERVLIVDWDVHHGQGTQRMFYDDPRVLYFSIHRYEQGRFWPQLRESDYDYIGKGKGEGFNINIPLNKTGMTDSDYMAVFNMVLLPVAYEFQPQLVLISSGYDAAVGCPEGEMLITPAMYAQMTHQLMGLASGRVCVVLEGGYCIKSLAEGCALTLRSLLRDPCPKLPPLVEPSESIMTTILNVIKLLRQHWKCFSHFETLGRSEVCPFADVNEMPPIPDVKFSTPENRPEKFQIKDCYPVQEEKTRLYFSDLINKLISEADLSRAEYKCCYVFDAEMRSHRNLHDKSHPERPERISRIYSLMVEWKLLRKCLTVASRLARKQELLWIHGEEYLKDLLKTQAMPPEDLHVFPNQQRYTSIYVHQKSLHCALLSCGSLLNVVEAVLRGKSQSGVAVVRPPGHHAESGKAMGFCFFNNVAIAAKFAQVQFGLKRILIVDWDVHHGNATQHQFYDDPSVLYISLHRFDGGRFFPGSSDATFERTGFGAGEGFNVNIPWSHARMGDSEYMAAFTQIVMPIAYQFAPELVLVSAGFDSAVGDPLGGYSVTPACFGHMTHMLMGLANGRVVLALEGGYNLNSLSSSMATCMSVLLGYPCPMIATLAPNERATETIHDVLEMQKKYWSSLKGYVRIPAVRKVDGDKWVIDKEQHQSRPARNVKSGPSKSLPNQVPRPHSAGFLSAESRNAVASLSDSSVTVLSKSSPTATATPSSRTSTESSKPTSSVTLKSSTTKTSSGTSGSSTIDTSETMSSSGPDFNQSNLNAGDPLEKGGEKPEPSNINETPNDSETPYHSGNTESPANEAETAKVTSERIVGQQDVENVVSDMKQLSVKDSQAAESFQKAASDVDVVAEILRSPVEGDLPRDHGHDSDPKPKVSGNVEASQPVFRSLIYGDESDPEPLSIFAGSPLMASQEEALIDRDRARSQSCAGNVVPGLSGAGAKETSHGSTEGKTCDPQCSVDNREAEGDLELMGACGGTNRPKTLQEFLRMQPMEQVHAVQPLPWCPHLKEVGPLPASGLDPSAPCSTCGDVSENWVCLTCYKVECSRFVNEHMLVHKLETDHNMVLSYSDLSVWCYVCDHYVDNEVLFPVKNAAHQMKFGESLA